MFCIIKVGSGIIVGGGKKPKSRGGIIVGGGKKPKRNVNSL